MLLVDLILHLQHILVRFFFSLQEKRRFRIFQEHYDSDYRMRRRLTYLLCHSRGYVHCICHRSPTLVRQAVIVLDSLQDLTCYTHIRTKILYLVRTRGLLIYVRSRLQFYAVSDEWRENDSYQPTNARKDASRRVKIYVKMCDFSSASITGAGCRCSCAVHIHMRNSLCGKLRKRKI